jgi:hypothetical protein
MGGFGSGRQRTKTSGTTDRVLSLDIHDLLHAGALTSGQSCTMTWHSCAIRWLRPELVPLSGHWIPEEQPQWLVKRVLSFIVNK